jgi:hypothetical protein
LEHGLKKDIRLIRLVTRHNFVWLHINLFAKHTFSQRDELRQETNLCVFFRDGLRIELVALEESCAEASRLSRVRVDVVQVSEGRLRQ